MSSTSNDSSIIAFWRLDENPYPKPSPRVQEEEEALRQIIPERQGFQARSRPANSHCTYPSCELFPQRYFNKHFATIHDGIEYHGPVSY